MIKPSDYRIKLSHSEMGKRLVVVLDLRNYFFRKSKRAGSTAYVFESLNKAEPNKMRIIISKTN